MSVRLITVAGPPSAGKTAVVRQILKNLLPEFKAAYLKIDVVQAWEDEELAQEFHIPTKKVYSGDMCPDHTGIMVLEDAVRWAASENADYLIYESAGLCLRCTPYTERSFGLCVVPAVSGMHTPFKMAPMISFADAVIVTKTDLVSQAEREVFREAVRSVSPETDIIETDAIQGTNMRYLLKRIQDIPHFAEGPDVLRGTPPLGVCTVCVGKKEVGWQNHFGVIRPLEAPDYLFRGE